MSRFVERSDGKTVDVDKVLAEVYDDTNKRLHTSATVQTGDIEIGAVELKDHDGSDRAAVNSSNELLVRDNDLIALQDNYAIQIATDSGDSDVTYVGKAAIGSGTGSSVWQIQKIDESSGTVITWCDGDDNFDNKWSEREEGGYS